MQEAAGIQVSEEPEMDPSKLAEDEIKRLEVRASRYGLPIEFAPYGADLGAKFACPRRELEADPDFLNDTLHCYGVDRLTTVRVHPCIHAWSCQVLCGCV
jgi:hypothetical protein